MKMYVISDNHDTTTGFRLVGIEGCVVSTKEEVKEQLEMVKSSKDIAILLIMESFARDFPETIKELKLTRSLPLVVEIPNRHGTGRTKDFISNYIREAIGVKLD